MNLEQLKKKYLNKNVEFIGGNFAGEKGKCIEVMNNAKAIYGVLLIFKLLEDGSLVTADKSDHFVVVPNSPEPNI